MPSARLMRDRRASGVLCDWVVIEPHELVYGECDSDEGKGMKAAERSSAASAEV